MGNKADNHPSVRYSSATEADKKGSLFYGKNFDWEQKALWRIHDQNATTPEFK